MTNKSPSSAFVWLFPVLYHNVLVETSIMQFQYVQIGVSTKTIGRYLKKLEDKVRFVGSGYSGHWEIIQK